MQFTMRFFGGAALKFSKTKRDCLAAFFTKRGNSILEIVRIPSIPKEVEKV